MNVYKKTVLDHYHHPRNCGKIDNPDFSTQEYNPSCGDLIAMQGKIAQNKLIDLRFEGKGCIISQACASFLTQECIGKTIDTIVTFDSESFQIFLGVSLGPLRLKCALLPLHALQEGIKDYIHKANVKDKECSIDQE